MKKVTSMPWSSMRLPHSPAIFTQPSAPKPKPATATPVILPLRSGEHHDQGKCRQTHREHDLGLDLAPSRVLEGRGEHRPRVDGAETELDEDGADHNGPTPRRCGHGCSRSLKGPADRINLGPAALGPMGGSTVPEARNSGCQVPGTGVARGPMPDTRGPKPARSCPLSGTRYPVPSHWGLALRAFVHSPGCLPTPLLAPHGCAASWSASSRRG